MVWIDAWTGSVFVLYQLGSICQSRLCTFIITSILWIHNLEILADNIRKKKIYCPKIVCLIVVNTGACSNVIPPEASSNVNKQGKGKSTDSAKKKKKKKEDDKVRILNEKQATCTDCIV